MTGKEIQKIIQKEKIINGHKLVCPNVSNFFIAEIDVLSVSGKGYAYEYEVKISRSDFFADKKKVRKHKMYANPATEWDKKKVPNYFIYVCPDGLIKAEELPEYAGLNYIRDGNLIVVKDAKMLHNVKPDYDKLKSKVLQLYQQRDALGCTLLTHLNREIKAANAKHEIERQEAFQKLMERSKQIKSKNNLLNN